MWLNLRIPDPDKRRLELRARESGMSVSEFVRRLIAEEDQVERLRRDLREELRKTLGENQRGIRGSESGNLRELLILVGLLVQGSPYAAKGLEKHPEVKVKLAEAGLE